jgi:polysaccharide deacetylase 2 family uncharacterized protein YibQ
VKWLWLLVICFALGAIAGGVLSGATIAPLRPSPLSIVDVPAANALPDGDETAEDAFSDDDVDTVPQIDSRIDGEAHIAFVLVSAGHSLALESPFLQLSFPLTVVIDPHASEAHDIAALAQSQDKAVYVQLTDDDASGETLRAIQKAFPDIRGIAGRFARGSALRANAAALAKAAARAHLGVFDEVADDAQMRKTFAYAGASYAGRSFTVDNHLAPAYVGFMLDQAVRVARAGRVVVMARPLPATLAAARRLAANAQHDGIVTEALPAQAPASQGE